MVSFYGAIGHFGASKHHVMHIKWSKFLHLFLLFCSHWLSCAEFWLFVCYICMLPFFQCAQCCPPPQYILSTTLSDTLGQDERWWLAQACPVSFVVEWGCTLRSPNFHSSYLLKRTKLKHNINLAVVPLSYLCHICCVSINKVALWPAKRASACLEQFFLLAHGLLHHQ